MAAAAAAASDGGGEACVVLAASLQPDTTSSASMQPLAALEMVVRSIVPHVMPLHKSMDSEMEKAEWDCTYRVLCVEPIFGKGQTWLRIVRLADGRNSWLGKIKSDEFPKHGARHALVGSISLPGAILRWNRATRPSEFIGWNDKRQVEEDGPDDRGIVCGLGVAACAGGALLLLLMWAEMEAGLPHCGRLRALRSRQNIIPARSGAGGACAAGSHTAGVYKGDVGRFAVLVQDLCHAERVAHSV